MFHLVEIVRKMLASGAPERRRHFLTAAASVRLHATARTPRSPTRAANAAASLSFARPSPRPLTGRPRGARASRRVARPPGSRIQQVFEKLFKFVGKTRRTSWTERTNRIASGCTRRYAARVHPPRSPRGARFARSLRTSRRGRKPTPTRARGDRLSGGSGGARTFFSRARRSFPPVRAFRAFATAAQPDSIPRVSDSSDEEISALPNGFGR